MPDSSCASPLVAVVVYDGLCTFEFGIATEVFGLDRPEMGTSWYRFAVCAAEPGPLRARGGFTILADSDLGVLHHASIIIIPGWRGADSPVPAELCDALRAAHGRGTRIMSLCSGIFVLAAAGLLSGRRGTTHWRYGALLAERYPDIRLEADVLYVDEGDVLTSAGSAAAIDLCLHVVRRDFGPSAANMVARRLVVPPHREGGQTQFAERPVPSVYEGSRLSPLMEKMRERLAEQQSIARLASEAGMSERTFLRRFKAATGLTPGEWLLTERIARAKDLLEECKASVDDIAYVCGFGSAATLRHHFRERIGVSPMSYRARFARV